MLPNPRLIVDGCCEMTSILKPWTFKDLYDFSKEDIDPEAIYVIGRTQMQDNQVLIRELIENDRCRIIVGNPHEGSETLMRHLQMWGLDDLARQGLLPILGGGDMEPCYDYLLLDHFLPKLLDYDENVRACKRSDEIFTKTIKPYKFLFLNGRGRSHRKYLIERLDMLGILDQSLWTWLDSNAGGSRTLRLSQNGEDLMRRPRQIKLLPPQYEDVRYRDRINLPHSGHYVKYSLFDNEWGEIYLNADAYIDTYFSVITETVFEYPYSFRTEKIWKPIVMGQPWIAVANRGYYRDMRALGFRTFDGLIDESFDDIEDGRERLERIIDIIVDLCRGNLVQFIEAARDICKYNQEHYAVMRERVRQEFPNRFFQFLRDHQWMT